MDSFTTDEFGKFASSFQNQYEHELEVIAWYNGNDEYWPARGRNDIISSIGKEGRLPSLDVKVFPNPVGRTLHFEYDLINPSAVSVEILDQAGRLVDHFGFENLSTGIIQNEIRINKDQYGRGVYFLKIRSADGIAVRKIFW